MEFDGCIALGIWCDYFPARGSAEYYFLSHAHTEYALSVHFKKFFDQTSL